MQTIYEKVSTMQQNINLLTKRFRRTQNFESPSKLENCGTRGLKHHWLDQSYFLVYTTKYDAAFCLPRTLLRATERKSNLIQKSGLSAWYKVNKKVLEHINDDNNKH